MVHVKKTRIYLHAAALLAWSFSSVSRLSPLILRSPTLCFCASLSRHRFGKGGARLLISGIFLEKKCLCARYWKVSLAPFSDGLSGKTFPRCFAESESRIHFTQKVFITRGPNGIGCVAHNIRSRRPRIGLASVRVCMTSDQEGREQVLHRCTHLFRN